MIFKLSILAIQLKKTDYNTKINEIEKKKKKIMIMIIIYNSRI